MLVATGATSFKITFCHIASYKEVVRSFRITRNYYQDNFIKMLDWMFQNIIAVDDELIGGHFEFNDKICRSSYENHFIISRLMTTKRWCSASTWFVTIACMACMVNDAFDCENSCLLE